MNSVAAIKPAMDGAVASAGAEYVNGIITIGYAKDPQDPKWNNDPAMKLYRTIIAKYGGGRDRERPAGLLRRREGARRSSRCCTRSGRTSRARGS